MSYTKSNEIRNNSHLCNESNIHEDTDEHHAPYKLMFLFFILFIGCMSFSFSHFDNLYFLKQKGLFKTMFISLRIPYTGVIIFIGFIGGILFNIFSNDDTFLIIATSSPDLLVAIFLPILVFESAYRIEYHAFMKSLYFILILSVLGYLISLFSISILNKYLFFFQQWNFLQCLTLGIILSATRPVTLLRPADYGKTKRLNLILEGETVINNCLAVILFNVTKNFVVNNQTWHTIQFFKTTSIKLAGGVGLGSIAAILEIIGLPYFYDDPISEITITIAVPYLLYWLCEQVYCSGVLGIVVLGLILSNYKTAISSEVSNFMEKFWDMLVLIANTIIYFFTALTIAELIKPNVRASFKGNTIFLEIGLAIINYFICYIIRFFTISSLILCTKLCRSYYLSWKECLLATWGGFKGSICLILALALASEFQLVDNNHNSSKFKYQILIHTTIVVFLSSCINSTYSILLKILKDFTTISEIKYLYMKQYIDLLRILVEEKIRLLKKNKYLANADWIFIEKNFQIENPHTINIIRDIHLINHDIQCSNCHRLLPIEFNQTQYNDLFEETRIRIINIQKTSFWRQYRDYEISTETVRILLSLCDFAIDTKGQYITIDQLKYYYKPRTADFIWKYLRLLVQKLHICIRDDWRKYQRVPKTKWCLFYFNILNHKRYNLLMAFIIFLNVILAIIRSAINISNKMNLILTIIQNICILIYILEFIVKIYTFGIRIYFRTWIDYRIEFILLILALIECIFEYYYLIYSKSISHQILSIMQILIIVQIFRLSRMIEYITANLHILLERIANRYVTLSLELCKACILSEDDILSKLNHIIEIEKIRDHFHKDLIKRRDEIINELTFIQNEHPNVSASVKTRAAIQKLLNSSKNMIHHMTNKGLLGENESHQITENINKRLHTELVPSVLFFPIPLHFLHLFPWLDDPDVLEYVLSRLHVKSFSLNEYIYKINNDVQALFFITAGYVETIKTTSKYHDALSIEKRSKQEENNLYEDNQINQSQSDYHLCHQCRIEKKNLLNEDLFQWSDDESEEKHFLFDKKNSNQNILLSHFNLNDSILDFCSTNKSTIFYRLINAPGDIIGHIDLLNGQKYTETCKCITNTLVWYLKSNDLIDLIKRFNHLQILEKLWHYTALQQAETILYEYLNILPYNATEQERIHIYGHLKYAFLIPESYLIEHQIIYSLHELILIQGQLKNIISSFIYTGPCFIQIEFGQCGLQPLNITETKILVLRSPHHTHHQNEFILSKDLPDLLTHVIYDEKLSIFLPRISVKI